MEIILVREMQACGLLAIVTPSLGVTASQENHCCSVGWNVFVSEITVYKQNKQQQPINTLLTHNSSWFTSELRAGCGKQYSVALTYNPNIFASILSLSLPSRPLPPSYSHVLTRGNVYRDTDR